ncbi:MAG: GTP 3',8-cyclase MoaA [Bacteroidetes bacterium]|nr:GTP 3',8-cyclase MoaA [Bacteroidota bacterium]MCW5894763.1 GTP 3',8-cyclase MoaA [Bacteroidota bacterium]
MSRQLIDTFGRVVTNLRISVTDRCNFRCSYCMPEEGMEWLKRNQLLTYEEITRLVRIFASLGIHKIRLTGGEPLMRKEVWRLVAMLKKVDGINDIALTTNGYFLAGQAQRLADAGLNRINVSLDSLSPGLFADLVRRDYFSKTWEGIEAADRAGLHPIKLNVVLIRGVNDGEILKFAELARTRGFVIRFIEFMPIGKDDGWALDKVVPTHEVLENINSTFRLIPMPHPNGKSPAERYMFADGKGEIGFISSVSQPFCGDCDRVRVTSDGKFRTCLFSLVETDLRGMLRGGADDEEIADALVHAVWKKEEGHLINQPGFVRPERTMSQIGG